jgi:four helix bundle protein
MSQIKSFRDLMVWQKGMDLGVGTLKLAKLLPRVEQMSLGHQLRKSAISIPSNIAEGFSRRSTAFYIQHLWTSHASGAELQTQLLLASRANLIGEPVVNALVSDAEEIGRMIAGLVGSLERGR